MNNLSILLYLADVSGSIAVITGIASILILFSAIILLLIKANGGDTRPYLRNTLIALFFTILATIITPSTETVYAIAASEITEDVVTSPQATKILDRLSSFVESKLQEPVQPTSSK